MKPLEQKIIDKFRKKFWFVPKNSKEARAIEPFEVVNLEQFILTSLQQVREETIKEIGEELTTTLNRYEIMSNGIDDDNKMLKDLIKIIRQSLTQEVKNSKQK